MWNGDAGVCSEWFEVAKGLPQGCVLSPLMFNVFFVVILFIVLERFSEYTNVISYLAHLQVQSAKFDLEAAQEYVRRAI